MFSKKIPFWKQIKTDFCSNKKLFLGDCSLRNIWDTRLLVPKCSWLIVQALHWTSPEPLFVQVAHNCDQYHHRSILITKKLHISSALTFFYKNKKINCTPLSLYSGGPLSASRYRLYSKFQQSIKDMVGVSDVASSSL